MYERNREESRWLIQAHRFKVKAEGETHTRQKERREGEERRERAEHEGMQQQHYWQQITKENVELFLLISQPL